MFTGNTAASQGMHCAAFEKVLEGEGTRIVTKGLDQKFCSVFLCTVIVLVRAEIRSTRLRQGFRVQGRKSGRKSVADGRAAWQTRFGLKLLVECSAELRRAVDMVLSCP